MFPFPGTDPVFRSVKRQTDVAADKQIGVSETFSVFHTKSSTERLK